MAKADAQLKVRKKKWFTIVAPKTFREVAIGEILLYESGDMKGRGMTVNMMNLTGNPKNQHINVKLRITEVKDGKGHTELLGFASNPGSIKRVVRRGKSKIEDSFVVATSDGKKVRIKPLLITSNLVANGVSSTIKRMVRNSVGLLAAQYTYERLVEEVITFKLQKHIGNTASRITPIKNSEVRAFGIVEREGVKAIVPVVEEEPPKEEEDYSEAEEPAQEAAEEQPTQEQEA